MKKRVLAALLATTMVPMNAFAVESISGCEVEKVRNVLSDSVTVEPFSTGDVELGTPVTDGSSVSYVTSSDPEAKNQRLFVNFDDEAENWQGDVSVSTKIWIDPEDFTEGQGFNVSAASTDPYCEFMAHVKETTEGTVEVSYSAGHVDFDNVGNDGRETYAITEGDWYEFAWNYSLNEDNKIECAFSIDGETVGDVLESSAADEPAPINGFYFLMCENNGETSCPDVTLKFEDSMKYSVSEEYHISDADGLAYAIAHQQDGQTWYIEDGEYVLTREHLDMYKDWKNPFSSSQGGWYLPLYANNLTIKGNGGALITSDVTTPNGAWATQDFVSVWGEGVTIEGVNFKSKTEQNKVIEVMNKDFTLRNSTLERIDEWGSGSIIFQSLVDDGDIGEATLEDVNLSAWITTNYSKTGTLNIKNVNIDFVDNEYAGYSDPTYGYGWCPGVFNSKSNVEIVNEGLSITVDDQINLAGQVLNEKTQPGTVIKLTEGTYTIDSKASISNDLTVEGNGSTINGIADDASAYIELTDGTFTISDVTFDSFGGDATTGSGNAIVKVPVDAGDTKVVANNVNASNFNRSAYDIRSGAFEITGGTIDCANNSESKLTKGILVGYGDVEGTIDGVKIYNSKSTYAGWSTAAIEVYNNANVDIVNCDITGVNKGVHVDNYWNDTDEGELNVNLSGNNIDAEDDAVLLYSTYEGTGGNVETNVNIADGFYKGAVRYVGKTDKDSIAISGGYYTENPSEHVVDGKIAVASDNADYSYMIAEAGETPAIVVPDAPQIDVDLPNNATEEDKAFADEISTAMSESTSGVIDSDVINATAGSVAQENTVTSKEGMDALQSAGVEVSSEAEVSIVVQPYMSIKVDAVDATVGSQSFTLDITPMYRTVAATDTQSIVTDGDSKNAVVLAEHELELDKAVTVTIPVPASFDTSKSVYVHHKKDGVTYVYEAYIAEKALTFTNPHGFSQFTVSTVAPQAKIGDTAYATLQDAVNAVKNGDTITVLSDGDATVGREVSFNVVAGEHKVKIYAGSGYDLAVDGISYTCTAEKSSGGGAHHDTSTGSSSSTKYDVDIAKVSNGDVEVSDDSAKKGDKVTITVMPDKGYEIEDVIVVDEDGDEVKVSEKDTGEYTFTMPASDVTVKVTFSEIETEENPTHGQHPFADVSSTSWYSNAVQYVYENSLMNGVTSSTFAPDSNVNRAMIAQILYNMKNPTEKATVSAFSDVAPTEWYAEPINWVVWQGYMSGYGDGKFGPNDALTREQLVTTLWRYSGSPMTASVSSLSVFSDASAISDYAKQAMAWAHTSGVISGNGNGTVNPKGTATRAEIAQILMNFCENVK